MKILTESARWRRSQIAERFAKVCLSASCYGLSKDVVVLAVVVPELELRKVQREILTTDVVERAEYATLEQCPKALDVVGMNDASNVLTSLVIHGLMREREPQHLEIRDAVGSEQIDFIGDQLANEIEDGSLRSVLDNLARHVAFTAYRANYGDLAGMGWAATVILPPLLPVPFFLLATDVSFVDFDDAHKLAEVFVVHRGAEPMGHIPSGAERRGFLEKHAPELERRNTFLALDDRPQHLEPNSQRILGVLENGSADEREPIGVPASAIFVGTLPLPRLIDVVDEIRLTAAWTTRMPVRPATVEQILPTSVFVGEAFHQFAEARHA